MLGLNSHTDLYREIEGLKGQLEKVTNEHRVLQQDPRWNGARLQQGDEMIKTDYLTELAGCGVPDDWVDDQGNERRKL